MVDPRGLVTTTVVDAPSSWSLDWWIGADDRWHTPSTEAGVRQRLVGAAPVVETLVRVPGGDAVHRAYAIHAAAESPFGRPYAVVEIENRSPVPFAVALAVVPTHPLGAGRVHQVALDGTTLVVDGRPAVLLAKPPSRAAAAAGDVASVVLGGGAPDGFEPLEAPEGDAEAAVVYPLPHTAVLRVVLPLGPDPAPGRSRTRRERAGGSAAPSTPSSAQPAALPSAEQVAKGWEVQTRRGLRLELPDPAVQDAVEAGRRFLLLAHGGEDLATWPAPTLGWVEAASVLGALDRYGFHDEVGQVLAALPERQALDGSLVGPDGRAAANGAALVAVAEHWRLTGETDLVELLVGPLAKAAHWLEKRRAPRRGPTRLSADDLGWAETGLRGIAGALEAAGQPEVAADCRRFAAAAAADRAGQVGGGDPRRQVELSGPAVIDPEAHAGLHPGRTLELATLELTESDPVAYERLRWVLGVASPTGVWPEVVHPRTGGGSRGAGHHLATGADVLTFVRRLLVRDHSVGLALCSVLPVPWWGQGLEVHEAPTRWGVLSFALRWHGERPALLWELDRRDPTTPFELSVPGIDPTWRSTEARGEALLAAPRAPSPPPAGEADRDRSEPAEHDPGAPAQPAAPPAPPAAPDAGASFS